MIRIVIDTNAYISQLCSADSPGSLLGLVFLRCFVERDLPDLLHFFTFSRHLWRKLRTTNVIERCCGSTAPHPPRMVFTNVASVERIIYAILSRFHEDWKNHTIELFTPAA